MPPFDVFVIGLATLATTAAIAPERPKSSIAVIVVGSIYIGAWALIQLGGI